MRFARKLIAKLSLTLSIVLERVKRALKGVRALVGARPGGDRDPERNSENSAGARLERNSKFYPER